MKAGFHYDSLRTSAQTPSHTARRLLLAEAARAGEEVRAFDVPSAYPRASADEKYRVTMRQPRRADGTYTKPNKLILIRRAQMGVPNGGFLWEKHRNTRLANWGWTHLQAEPGTFIYEDKKTKHIARLVARTDDFLMSSKSGILLDYLESQLSQHWDIERHNELTQHMGLANKQSKANIEISVTKHCDQLISLLKLEDANAVQIPHQPDADLTKIKPDEDGLNDSNKLLFQQGIGTARFLADTVFYEISYIVAKLAQSQMAPTKRHMQSLKHMVRYVKGQRLRCLSYKHDGSDKLSAFSDSDFATCPDTRSSRTGMLILYAGDPIHWASTLQKSITLSSAEAELYAASETARVVSWLRRLATEW